MMHSTISKIINKYFPSLSPYESLYKDLHLNPELSQLEKETAALVKSKLSELGVKDIYSGIGGHGVAAVISNGSGQTILLRADMDALPIEEKTDLKYISKKRMKNIDGIEKPVMHACGHDMHITVLLATTELMLAAKSTWSGTLILCFQPAEENGVGARAMVEGGLYNKVPIPDIVLGGHVFPFRSGTIRTKRGPLMSAADSYHVTLYGRGAHGSQPHRGIDPVVMAASTVMRLQTIISRETNPAESSVVTVGAINAGDAENVIPSHAELKLNIRNFSPAQRLRAIDSIKRIIKAESEASNAPNSPDIKVISSFPLTVNDVEITAKLEDTFFQHFPAGPHGYQSDMPQIMGSEDFGLLGSLVDKPYSYFIYGGIDPDLYDKAEKDGNLLDVIPTNHSPFFAPVIQPTLRVGVEGYAAAALTWLRIGN